MSQTAQARPVLSRRSALALLGAAPGAAGIAAGSSGAAGGPTGGARPAGAGDLLAEADRLFEAGSFAAADAAYRAGLAADPHNVHALTRHGQILLLANQVPAAARTLSRALRLSPGSRDILGLLALSHYRGDRFELASPLYRSLGDTATADQLASFAGLVPYQLRRGPRTATLPFLVTDPLPMLDVSVNGLPAEPFVLDTGADKLVVHSRLATAAGIPTYGSRETTCGGGKHGSTTLGHLGRLGLGPITVHNVPVGITDQAGMPLPDGRRTAGVLSTSVLRHFLSTIDYPAGELRLRPPAARPAGPGELVVPCWLAGGHFIVAEGTINGAGPWQFVVDTGGPAGVGPSARTITETGIRLDPALGHPATGCGGTVTVIPFTADTVTLGPVVRHRLPGTAGFFPDVDANGQGFRTAGAVSHRFFRPSPLTLDFTGMRLLVGAT